MLVNPTLWQYPWCTACLIIWSGATCLALDGLLSRSLVRFSSRFIVAERLPAFSPTPFDSRAGCSFVTQDHQVRWRVYVHVRDVHPGLDTDEGLVGSRDMHVKVSSRPADVDDDLARTNLSNLVVQLEREGKELRR